MILPCGAGGTPTQLACAVVSPTRAAGKEPMSTVPEPFAMTPGPPGTHPGNVHGFVIPVAVAAGLFPTNTFGCPLMIASGKGGWGSGEPGGIGGCIGA